MKTQQGFTTKFFILLLTLLLNQAAQADKLKVMNFNTMCDICDTSNSFGLYSDRIKWIADTVKRHNPDLISFQEFQSADNVKDVAKRIGEPYHILFDKNSSFPATDTVLFLRKSRFDVISSEGVWLGPDLPDFSYGWKFGVPRRFHWAHAYDKITGVTFVFAGTHFDNSGANKNPSAAWAQTFFQKNDLPLIFAGDTNLEPSFPGYKVLVGSNMRNSFDEKNEFQIFSNAPYEPKDACPDNVKTTWPDCRIDHVLLSANAPWKVIKWNEDLYRYYKGKKFVSDHRAVIVELE